jgi:hypothetical protein
MGTLLLLVLAFVVLMAWYLSWTASRLDRLHGRVEAARATLDAQLLRRASAAQDLATSGLLDPASSVLLVDAAEAARAADGEARELAESDLTRALRAALADGASVDAVRAAPGGEQLLDNLTAASQRVALARRFHNDAVRATRAIRRKRTVRYLRLAGHAPIPPTIEIDDTSPAALTR